MCIHIVQRLTAGYATDSAIKELVDGHEIYVIPSVNPDGSAYDISGGRYHSWRKNRQGNGTPELELQVGLLRRFEWQHDQRDLPWHGSLLRTRDQGRFGLVNSRKIGGVQQIKTHDFHTYSELVLWPFGYTYNATAPGLTAAEAQKFKTLGQQMAATNGYTAEQSSGLDITDGDINDWMWGTHKILSYCFEMYAPVAARASTRPPR
jgi:hypothetical protein